MADIYTMGIDLGSAASKCVILRSGSEIIGSAVIPFGAGTSGPTRAVKEALDMAKLQRSDISFTTATGYGRESCAEAETTLSELSCHALGAARLCPGARTVIDIGGQDAKVLSLGPDGKLQNFIMNDKCAAGTGRFLEVMARVLETDVSELAGLDASASGLIPITSTCTVFAESEVISQMSRCVPIPDLVAGIHRSVAVRTASLVKRLGVQPPIVMTGGVARNAGVLRALADALGTQVQAVQNPELCGALGAALSGWQKKGAL